MFKSGQIYGKLRIALKNVFRVFLVLLIVFRYGQGRVPITDMQTPHFLINLFWMTGSVLYSSVLQTSVPRDMSGVPWEIIQFGFFTLLNELN